jgi:hypothetical protein
MWFPERAWPTNAMLRIFVRQHYRMGPDLDFCVTEVIP